jgi:hypothetical protein
LRKKCENYFLFASLKSMKKEVGSGVGSGSISQRYDPDRDPHQNVTDPGVLVYPKNGCLPSRILDFILKRLMTPQLLKHN